MRAYVIPTNTILIPFGDPVGETLVLDRPLREVQEDALRTAGLEPIFDKSIAEIIASRSFSGNSTAGNSTGVPEPAIVLHDTLFFTPRLLSDFIEHARRAHTDGTIKPCTSHCTPDECMNTGGARPPGAPGQASAGPVVPPYLKMPRNSSFQESDPHLNGAGHGLPCPMRLWMKKGLFTRLLAVLQEQGEDEDAVSLPLWYLPAGCSMSDPAMFSTKSRKDSEKNSSTKHPGEHETPGSTAVSNDESRLVIDVDEESYAGNFPEHMIKKEGYRFGVTSRPAMAITNPLHLALANMAANFARLAELKKMSWPQKIFTLIRARSINKFRILATVSRIHPEAEVHPTAVIEGSIIEKGAKIGAHAVVRFSYVGQNAFIDDQAGIKFSVVGNGAYIANNCVLFFTTVYPRAFLISGPYQFSLFGYDSAMMNAIPSDYRLDGESITIRTTRGVVSTGLKFVGSVIGHRTKIAAGVIVAPGRMIPNDIQILPDPARVLSSVPDDIPINTPLFLISGKLVPAHAQTARPSSSAVTSQANNPSKETHRNERGHLRQGPGRLSRGSRHPQGKNNI
ncbi:MAG: hypothetical protein HQM09_12795 [Candidatus Riflebacteria bacterium]|nr:hypothetical protein [Candidatus Riflebacteria bacterium]